MIYYLRNASKTTTNKCNVNYICHFFNEKSFREFLEIFLKMILVLLIASQV